MGIEPTRRGRYTYMPGEPLSDIGINGKIPGTMMTPSLIPGRTYGAKTWQRDRHGQAKYATPWSTLQAQWAGGALAIDTNSSNGQVRHVYGLTHCGMLFMVDPAMKRALVMFHFWLVNPSSEGQTHSDPVKPRIESSLAVQAYRTPSGDVSKLFISITESPNTQRFDTAKGAYTGSLKYTAPSKIFAVHGTPCGFQSTVGPVVVVMATDSRDASIPGLRAVS